jgi:hypothetical protein
LGNGVVPHGQILAICGELLGARSPLWLIPTQRIAEQGRPSFLFPRTAVPHFFTYHPLNFETPF